MSSVFELFDTDILIMIVFIAVYKIFSKWMSNIQVELFELDQISQNRNPLKQFSF